MRKSTFLIVLFFVFSSLIACGKYSEEYTTLVLNDNKEKVNENDNNNLTSISIKTTGSGFINTVSSSFSTYWVYVDDVAVFSTEYGKGGDTFKLSSGKHTVYVTDDNKFFGQKSNEIEFEVHDNTTLWVTLDVTAEKNGSLSLVSKTEEYQKK